VYFIRLKFFDVYVGTLEELGKKRYAVNTCDISALVFRIKCYNFLCIMLSNAKGSLNCLSFITLLVPVLKLWVHNHAELYRKLRLKVKVDIKN
jgi:hypothetical protein